jgi:hypothetical protein
MYKTIIAALALCSLIANHDFNSTVSVASVDQHPQQASGSPRIAKFSFGERRPRLFPDIRRGVLGEC